jgi:membrane-associated phospholipid phosphatase
VAATSSTLIEWRVIGLMLVVPTALLSLGSVYGQFHYAVDVVAGLGLGLAVAAGVWLTSRQPSGAARVDPENLPTWSKRDPAASSEASDPS